MHNPTIAMETQLDVLLTEELDTKGSWLDEWLSKITANYQDDELTLIVSENGKTTMLNAYDDATALLIGKKLLNIIEEAMHSNAVRGIC